MSHKRDLRITVTLSALALAMALVPGAQAATVCNEAGVGHLGGEYVVSGTPDPDPPARHKSGLKPLGNGNAKGEGLVNAAERSPALSQCELPAGDGDDPSFPPPDDGAV